jgi:hypothetical protein
MLEANTTRFIFAIAAFVVGGGLMFGAQEVFPDVVEDARDKIVGLLPPDDSKMGDGLIVVDKNNDGEVGEWDEIPLGKDQNTWRIMAKKGDYALVFKTQRLTANGADQTTYWYYENKGARNQFFESDENHPYLGSNLDRFSKEYYERNFPGHPDEVYIVPVTIQDPTFSQLKGHYGITGNYNDFKHENWINQKDYITQYRSGSKKTAFVPSVSDINYWEIDQEKFKILTFSNESYWLRSNANENTKAACVKNDSYLQATGMGSTLDLRPALIINLSEAELKGKESN